MLYGLCRVQRQLGKTKFIFVVHFCHLQCSPWSHLLNTNATHNYCDSVPWELACHWCQRTWLLTNWCHGPWSSVCRLQSSWSPNPTDFYFWYSFVVDDQHKNTNMNDKDHLVGQLTNYRGDMTCTSFIIWLRLDWDWLACCELKDTTLVFSHKLWEDRP